MPRKPAPCTGRFSESRQDLQDGLQPVVAVFRQTLRWEELVEEDDA